MPNVEPSFVLYALLLEPGGCLRAHITLFELVEPEGKKKFDVVYDVPLKWEDRGAQVDWCEAMLVTQPEMAMLMKGVTFQHPSKVNPQGNFLL